MPLKIHPIKVKDTHYLLVPKDIAKMLDIDSSNSFILTTEKSGGNLGLLYQREKIEKGEKNG